MDRRIIGLIAFGGVLAILVAVIVIARAGGGEEETASTDISEKPVVEVPEGPPPEDLVVEDIVHGEEGRQAQEGDRVAVQYVGVDYETGREFDTSWDDPAPFEFTLGAGDVIPGWDRGVAGMHVGGRRRLVIPPELAYGEQGSPPAIGPNATLVFVVDLVAIR